MHDAVLNTDYMYYISGPYDMRTVYLLSIYVSVSIKCTKCMPFVYSQRL